MPRNEPPTKRRRMETGTRRNTAASDPSTARSKHAAAPLPKEVFSVGYQSYLPTEGDIDVTCTPEALFHVVVRGAVGDAVLLICRGANMEGNHETALHVAAVYGRDDMAGLLLLNGADVNAVAGSYPAQTPLHDAVQHGHVAVVKLLLSNGADVNANDYHNHTALHLVTDGYMYSPTGDTATTIAGILLDHGADTTAEDDNGFYPLHEAARSHNDVANVVANVLIDKGADVNAKLPVKAGRYCGDTPLHVAAQHGTVAMVDLLCHNGAEVNVRSQSYPCWTPLHVAALENRPSIVQALIDNGAHVNASKCTDNETPLHLAAGKGYDEVCQVLLQNGADVDANSPPDPSPLFRAALRGHVSTARLLLSYGADVNAKHGDTPLHVACELEDGALAELLLANGADANALDRWGCPPLHRAGQAGTRVLIAAGASLNARDEDARTRLHY